MKTLHLLFFFAFTLTYSVEATVFPNLINDIVDNIKEKTTFLKPLNDFFSNLIVFKNGTVKLPFNFQIPNSNYLILEELPDLLGIYKPRYIEFKPFSHPLKDGYNEHFVFKQIYTLCAASYAEDPIFCLKNAYPLVEVKRAVQRKCDNVFSVCASLTAISHEEKNIYIAFRGTDTKLQLITEIQSIIWIKLSDSPIGGKIGTYFKNNFELVWNPLKEAVKELIEKYPDYDIILTGHSLGGALAVIGAAQLASDGVDVSKLYVVTLGQPRVGDKEFVQKYDEILSNHTYRVINRRDIVPHIPPIFFQNYRHTQNEIWYSNTSQNSFKYCLTEETPDCSESSPFFSILNHVTYFERSFSSFLNQNCTFEEPKNVTLS